MSRSIKDVKVLDIEIPKSRVKKVDLGTDGGELLLESVKKQGILHPPLVQPPKETGGKYRLVFGQRRWNCAKKLKLETIRVTVDDSMSDAEVEQAILAENLFRKGDKSPTDRRKAVARWWDLHKAALEAEGKEDGKQYQTKGNSYHDAKQNGKVKPKEEEESTEEAEEESDADGDTGARRAPLSDEQEESGDGGADDSGDDESERAFSRKIQDATGCSRRKAQYDAAIAKAFNEEQLDVIGALGLSEEIVRQLAAIKSDEDRNAALTLISGGRDPQDAIDNARKDLAAAKKNRRRDDDELTDGEWLEQYCGEFRSKLTNLKAFDTSALLYRKTRSHLGVLKAGIWQDVRNGKLNKAGDPLTAFLSMAIAINHPSQWLLCGVCSGTGGDGNAGSCGTCRGCGFKLSFGEVKK